MCIRDSTYVVDTLRSAIEEANSVDFPDADVITFADGLTESGPATITISNVGDSFTFISPTSYSGFGINSDITITGPSDGPGVELTVSGALRHFQVNDGGRLSLNHLMITGGRATNNIAGNGGAVLVLENGVLNVNQCLLDDNIGRNGGAIAFNFNAGAGSVINNSVLSNNSIHPGFNSGAALQVATGNTVTVQNSSFTSNYSPYNAGAITVAGNIFIENTTIANNSADRRGGGIVVNNTGSMTMNNSTVSGNTANLDGGGILIVNAYADNETVIVNSTITGNTADADGSPSMRTFRGGSAGLVTAGGGISSAYDRDSITIHNLSLIHI